jgi:hypothetical protein
MPYRKVPITPVTTNSGALTGRLNDTRNYPLRFAEFPRVIMFMLTPYSHYLRKFHHAISTCTTIQMVLRGKLSDTFRALLVVCIEATPASTSSIINGAPFCESDSNVLTRYFLPCGIRTRTCLQLQFWHFLGIVNYLNIATAHVSSSNFQLLKRMVRFEIDSGRASFAKQHERKRRFVVRGQLMSGWHLAY